MTFSKYTKTLEWCTLHKKSQS